MDIRRRLSKRQESKVAKELSGKVTPASGALWGAKADVRNDTFLVECKTTEKDFYSLTFNTWDKIYHEAIKDSLRIPVMCIDLQNGKQRYAVMCSKDLPDSLHSSLYLLSDYDYLPKTSFRIKIEGHILITDKKNKVYELSVIEWSKFLDKVVSEYEQK